MMLSRSRVERARRSRRVTTSTSPDSSRRITLASSGLSVFAPEAFSLKMLPQPAACSSAIWPARSWSRVDTRAYPKVAISLSSFERDFRINKALENSGQGNYSQLVSFESGAHVSHRAADRVRAIAMNSPAVATAPPDGLRLVWAGAPSAYLPEQVYSYLPDGLQLVRAQYSLATGHERGDPEFPASSTNFPNNPTYLPQTNKAISHTKPSPLFDTFSQKIAR